MLVTCKGGGKMLDSSRWYVGASWCAQSVLWLERKEGRTDGRKAVDVSAATCRILGSGFTLNARGNLSL